ncbi:MAG: gamma-glutamylcyclotransferase family protein [Pseudomonadota bacterium]
MCVIGGFFFGYGSLVNKGTHAFAEAHPAQLRGWRRMWRKTTLRQAAYLTVVPDANAEIDGLIAEVPHGNWDALDERERAYARVDAAHQVSHPLTATPPIVVYAIEDGRHGAPDRQSPVLLSYIDVVVQGYLQVFGEDGVVRFFETTGGWDAPVVDDRANPVYPRHQSLSAKERSLVDNMLNQVEARREPLKTLSPWRE